ncbi:hypothetical protein HELRODRAFT_173423 [Helobdella robusta]|uniref:Uncharacterized protein n=1 Tax=Helobdella robusta TaxID=6412 RepID=T1F6T2_HELRO|nr:hypothetical protein HELRODRAFT_173423 [Helobdella robusta]ESO03721.1 hypothetical protein HELRODRAFT_173423 [Helobdella robusta]
MVRTYRIVGKSHRIREGKKAMSSKSNSNANPNQEISQLIRNLSYINQQSPDDDNPRPVFTGPVCQSVGFRTTLACFHWAVKSDRLSHDQGPVFTGPVCQSVGFRTTLACFHWAVKSDRLSHDQGPVFTGPVCQSVGFRTTLACFHWAVKSDRLSHDQGPVFTGPVCQSVGFRTTLACFHWAVKSDRLSHDQHKTTRVRTTLNKFESILWPVLDSKNEIIQKLTVSCITHLAAIGGGGANGQLFQEAWLHLINNSLLHANELVDMLAKVILNKESMANLSKDKAETTRISFYFDQSKSEDVNYLTNRLKGLTNVVCNLMGLGCCTMRDKI